ncbi:MAG: Hsp20/alpha crystallin family protein [bacterium]|nr:Hsp20/alpha crystallin family protein [bacterium]
MLNKEKEKKNDVFEMVLKSSGGGYVFNPTKNTTDKPSFASASLSQKSIEDDWHEDHQEGQLAIDVINTDKNIVVMSTMAGANVAKIEVYVHNDLLTIKGERVMPQEEIEGGNFMHQECYWGKFSRTVVLPVDVKGDSAKAKYENGILTIIITKKKLDSRIKIKVVEN